MAAWARRFGASPRMKAEGLATLPFLGARPRRFGLSNSWIMAVRFVRTLLGRFVGRSHARTEIFLQLRDFPVPDLHPQAPDALSRRSCVWRQGDSRRFWSYHDMLFATQGHAPEFLRTRAGRLGVDLVAYDACIAARVPEADIQASVDAGIGLGIRGTPTFFPERGDGGRVVSGPIGTRRSNRARRFFMMRFRLFAVGLLSVVAFAFVVPPAHAHRAFRHRGPRRVGGQRPSVRRTIPRTRLCVPGSA